MDIEQIVSDVLNKTKSIFFDIITEDVPKLVDAAKTFLENAERRYAALLHSMADGASVKYLLDHLEEEKDLFKSQVLSFVIIGKVIATNIINAIQDIILTAVKLVVPGYREAV